MSCYTVKIGEDVYEVEVQTIWMLDLLNALVTEKPPMRFGRG